METKQKQSISPYDYQKEALENLKKERKSGNDSGLLVMATGTGKTITSAFDTQQFNAENVLFIAHQKEIVEQAREEYEKAYSDEIDTGMFYGEKRDKDSNFLFATRQTLYRKQNLNDFDRERFDYIIVDEAHHAMSDTYQKIIDYFNPEFLLGLTATPYLIDVDQEDILDFLNLKEPTFSYNLDEATEKGDLSEFQANIFKDNIDYGQAPEDLSEKDLNKKLYMPERNKYIAKKWIEEAEGRKTIAFCRTIKHAERTALHFCEKGVKARAVHSKMKDKKRNARIEMFRKGEIDVLTGVDVFNEGVDFPNVGCLIFMRPTMSERIFMQQLGRGLRKIEGKDRCIVLDFVNETDWERLQFYGVPENKTQYKSGKCHECGTESSELLENEKEEFVCIDCRTDDFKIQTGIGEVEADIEAMFDIADQYQTYRFNKNGYSKEYLVKCLQELADELGESPFVSECNKSDLTPSHTVYQRKFGSWNNALKKAGLETNKSTTQDITKNKLAKELKQLDSSLDREIKSQDISKSDLTSGLNTYRRVFGSLEDALKESDVELSSNIGQKYKYTKESVLESLIDYFEEFGKIPTSDEFDSSEQYPSSYTVRKYFDSWSNAKNLLEEAVNQDKKATDVIKEKSFIEDLKKVNRKTKGQKLSQSQYDSQGIHPSSTIQRYFGSWRKALDEAGIETHSPPRKTSNPKLLAKLSAFWNENDEPTISKYQNKGDMSTWVFKNRFGSWSEAKSLAKQCVEEDKSPEEVLEENGYDVE